MRARIVTLEAQMTREMEQDATVLAQVRVRCFFRNPCCILWLRFPVAELRKQSR
eukprot:COSAG01_NODE_4154_length_5292_cov_6.751396_3_plen_54_part_00